MTLTKTIISFSTLLALLPGLAQAQDNVTAFDFTADSVANYRQGTKNVSFEGGTFSVRVRDGLVVYQTGCIAPIYFSPSLTCPIGASGFVIGGDFDDDGIDDAGEYLSVQSIFQSILLRPFSAQGAILLAGPPSLLPRPLAGFTDNGSSVFYDIQTIYPRQYSIANYEFARQYTAGERARFDGEAVPGTYRYSFDALAAPTAKQVLPITLFPRLDGYRKISNQRQGLLFTGLKFDDGFAILDPTKLNKISWTGNSVSLVSPSLDRLFFSIKRLTDPNDPLSDPVIFDEENPIATLPIFPNFDGPNVTRILLPSPLDQSVTIPPNFLVPGESGVIDLEFEMYRPSSPVIADRTIVRFRLPVRVAGNLGGLAANRFAVTPPAGVSWTVYNDPKGDFDNDGVSNFEEWVFGSDRNDPSSTPKNPGLTFKPGTQAPSGGTGTFSLSDTDAAWEFRIERKVDSTPALHYEIQHTTDMVNWRTIKKNDPDWKLHDQDPTELKVTSRTADVKGGGFFRAKVTNDAIAN